MAGGVKVKASRDTELTDEKFPCPSCKLTKISNPQIRWKFSTKCYHRVCEGCIDRLYTSGRAPCPLQTCQKQLWKSDWRDLRFEDVQMERDIASRKRVMDILKRSEEDFESKRDWDDFLEMREEMIMNLSLGTDVIATNRKLEAYQEAAQKSKKAAGADDARVDPTGLVQGLKKVVAAQPLAPYDSFMGMPTTKDYYELRDHYPSRWEKLKDDQQVVVGGFDFRQFWDESLLRAFAGLGCFLEDEMAEREEAKRSTSAIALKQETSDVF